MKVGFQSGLPFIGFGFVDNFLMIVAVRDFCRSITSSASKYISYISN